MDFAMDTRHSHILEAAVREFIKTGEPVSSQHLYERYRFGVKPAMIRWELNNLADEGFLEQPYHSAGRVPTNRGYEFFAAHALEEAEAHAHIGPRFLSLFERMAWPELLDALSDELGLLGVAADPDGTVYREGLFHLIDRLDWHSRPEVTSVIRDVEDLDEHMKDAEDIFDEDSLKVFVGRKSPVTKSQCLSVVAGKYEVDGESIVILMIGPTRMDYERVARVMKGLKRVKK